MFISMTQTPKLSSCRLRDAEHFTSHKESQRYKEEAPVHVQLLRIALRLLFLFRAKFATALKRLQASYHLRSKGTKFFTTDIMKRTWRGQTLIFIYRAFI